MDSEYVLALAIVIASASRSVPNYLDVITAARFLYTFHDDDRDGIGFLSGGTAGNPSP